jgi:glyoxylase-like metal-dependent hydrolase (beta-lactamase superfamily II)
MLPANLLVFERGWLSSNNILFLEGEQAALIDSGYVSHASQTVALLEHALAGRRLTRLLNTHSHSDHIGGNAAVTEAFGCRVVVPAGIDATIAEWDEEALLLSPLGQSAARFRHDETIAAGDHVELGGLDWQAIAVPGHDMDALAFHNPERRLLISGDALWRNGFGVIFSELLGHPEDAGGLKAARETLDVLARLPVDGGDPGPRRALRRGRGCLRARLPAPRGLRTGCRVAGPACAQGHCRLCPARKAATGTRRSPRFPRQPEFLPERQRPLPESQQ